MHPGARFTLHLTAVSLLVLSVADCSRGAASPATQVAEASLDGASGLGVVQGTVIVPVAGGGAGGVGGAELPAPLWIAAGGGSAVSPSPVGLVRQQILVVLSAGGAGGEGGAGASNPPTSGSGGTGGALGVLLGLPLP